MFRGSAFHVRVLFAIFTTSMMAGSHVAAASATTPDQKSGIPNPVHRTISAGGYHACHLTGRRQVLCYGHNRFGSLGDGMLAYQREEHDRAALRAAGLSSVLDVTSGERHSCALVASGQVYCWGANDGGQVGDGTLTNRPVPVPVFGLADAISVSAGADHSCALRVDRTVSCWGRNSDGELGVGDRIRYTYPVAVPGLSGVISVSAGGSSENASTCAITIGGQAFCWGANNYGQLGTPATSWQLSPVLVPDRPPLASISVGGIHACGLDEVGQVLCWGNNNWDQLGQDLDFDATAVVASGSHSCALLQNRTVTCWGQNDYGNLGNGSFVGSATPVAVAGLDDVVELAADSSGGGSLGRSHTCAKRANGEVYCWGSNRYGKIGDGYLGIAVPATVDDAPASYTQVAAGGDHSCGLLAGGGARCWGTNDSGQLGNGTTLRSAIPQTVVGLADAVQLAAGRFHTCALHGSGNVSCWGANNYGQLGSGTTSSSLLPQSVMGISTAVAVVAGGSYSCALLVSGTALCWGLNESGQLGTGTNSYQELLPATVAWPDSLAALSAGLVHACAQTASGRVICWGANRHGQLGDDSASSISRWPVLAAGINDAVAIVAGGESRDIITGPFGHSCALLASGRVKCWGYNAYGQVGDGTLQNRRLPVEVPGLGNVIALSAGGTHTCATSPAGALRCWGGNDLGQVGNASTVNIDIPSTFLPAPALDSVSAGRDHTCAIGRSSHLPVCWGNNRYLAIGIASGIARPSPTRVRGLPDQLDFADTIFSDGFD